MVSACFNWIRLIALSPMPRKLAKWFQLQTIQPASADWWDNLPIDTAADQRRPTEIWDAPADWTVQEQRNLMHVLHIAKNAVALVRSRLNRSLEERDAGAVQLTSLFRTVDFPALAGLFCSCLPAALHLSGTGGTVGGLREQLQRSLSLLAQDSLSALHLLLSIPAFQQSLLTSPAVQQSLSEVLLLTQRLPAPASDRAKDSDDVSGFVAVTGRWLQDQLYRIQYQIGQDQNQGFGQQ